MERLEPREVPAVITVTSLADANIGSQHTGVTLRDAVQAAETDTSVNGSVAGSGADTIVFDPSLTAGGSATVMLNNGGGTLFLRADVTIDGGGGVTIDGNNSGMFYVLAGVTVHMSGLTITHGKSGLGGGVYNEGTLTLDHVTLTNNVASALLSGRTFIETSGSGGGVFNNGTLTINDSTISNNSAASAGGGVTNAGTLTVTRSTIVNNTTTSAGTTTSSGTTFIPGTGGGIHNGGVATIIQSTVANNTASDGLSSNSTGGGVSNVNTLSIVQSTIVGNHATLNGGGVSNSGTLTVSQSTVAGNTASGTANANGGGVYNSGTATVIQTTITDNLASASGTASATGGGVYNNGTLALDNDSITDNTATSAVGNGWTRGGGVFDDNGGTTTLTQCTVANNSGGGVVTLFGTLTLTQCTVINNSGGVVSMDGTVALTQCSIINNSGGVGVINDLSGTMTLSRCTIANNTNGGVFNSGTFVATQCTVANELYNVVTMTLTQCTVVNNAASVGGGVDNHGTLILANTLVVGNTAVIGPDVTGGYTDHGGNLVGVPVGFTLGQVVQVDGSGVPLLANNGGPTKTIALANGSPAIDAGLDANANGLTTDQRGFNRIALAHVDVGAVESQATPPSLPLAIAIGSQVKITDPTTGAVLTTLNPFPGFGGSVSAVVADFTGDGVPDYAVGAGAGGGPHVKVYNGATGAEVASFYAFDAAFAGGVSLAAGDVTGDGVADLVVGAGAGGGPHVKVFSGPTFAEVRSFFAYDASFAGGVTVAAGDLDGDGFAEIITGAGAGGSPLVKAFDGRTGAVVRSFNAYDSTFSGGVNVAAADLNGDGKAEIITGAGGGGGPHVKAFTADDVVVASFFAYDAAFAGGVRVAVRDVNSDGVNDIVTAAGPGGGPHVKAFDWQTTTELESFFAGAPDDHRGVFVG